MFKWCMRYHQKEKKKNAQNISALKKVVDKYDYSDMSFRTNYEDIENFEEINQVCIFVYELDDAGQKTFRTSKQGLHLFTIDSIRRQITLYLY